MVDSSDTEGEDDNIPSGSKVTPMSQESNISEVRPASKDAVTDRLVLPPQGSFFGVSALPSSTMISTGRVTGSMGASVGSKRRQPSSADKEDKRAPVFPPLRRCASGATGELLDTSEFPIDLTLTPHSTLPNVDNVVSSSVSVVPAKVSCRMTSGAVKASVTCEDNSVQLSDGRPVVYRRDVVAPYTTGHRQRTSSPPPPPPANRKSKAMKRQDSSKASKPSKYDVKGALHSKVTSDSVTGPARMAVDR